MSVMPFEDSKTDTAYLKRIYLFITIRVNQILPVRVKCVSAVGEGDAALASFDEKGSCKCSKVNFSGRDWRWSHCVVPSKAGRIKRGTGRNEMTPDTDTIELLLFVRTAEPVEGARTSAES